MSHGPDAGATVPGRSRGPVGAAVGGRRHLRLRPLPPPGRGIRHRLAAADGQRLPARGPRAVLHAHRPGRPLPADARPQRVLPGGLGRQRAADRAPGAAGLRGALRAHPAVRPGLPPTVHAGPEAAGAGEPARVHRAVPAAGRRGRGGVRGGVAAARAVGGLVAGLLDDRRAVPAHRAAGLPARPGPRRRVPGGRRRRCGTWTSAPRWRRPSWPTGRWPAPGTRLAFGPVTVDTTRPELLPACVAVVAHPDDERYAALVGGTVRTPLFGVEVPVLRAPRWPTRARAPGWRWCARSAT